MNRLELAEKLREIAYDVEQGKEYSAEHDDAVREILRIALGVKGRTHPIVDGGTAKIEDFTGASLRERFPSGSIVEVPKRDAMSYVPTPTDLDTFLPVVLKGDDGQGGDVHYTINGKRVTQAEVDKLAESGCGYMMTTAVQRDRDGKITGKQVEVRTYQ